MAADVLLSIASAIAYFAIAAMMALRGSREPLTAQVGLMAALLAAYATLDVVEQTTGDRRWDHLAYGAAALVAIPTLDLVVTFVGRRRGARWLRWSTGLCFVVMAALSVGAFVSPRLALLHRDGIWPALMVGIAAPAFAYGSWLVVRHTRASRGEERARGLLLISAVALGVGGSMLDLVLIAAKSALRFSQLPLLASSILIAGLVLRARLLTGVTSLSVAAAGAVALLATMGQVAVFAWADTSTAIFVGGTAIVVVGLMASLRPLLGELAAERERGQHLATMGRFTAQMAHDLKNPIAAIRGAAQFLQEEANQGRSLDPHLELIELIAERTARLSRVIDDYRRLSRVEPRPEPIDLVALVRDTLEGQSLAADDVRVQLHLGEGAVPFHGDPDLIAAAIENVFRNACEALDGEGSIDVTLSESDEGIRLSVVDDGVGMDPRTRERALDDFFTTKAEGSGLGLAFATRVARAHGGRLDLADGDGGGTRVTFELPSPGRASETRRRGDAG